MDTRIEELATIIIERCGRRGEPRRGADDRYDTYWHILRLAEDMKRACEGYRQRHPEEYD